ncbi:MAG TPA: hypothetical protein VLV88_16015 [Terriglobales bacterium]|nr:hypothetical protein [Terriglobales bacterium]
MSNKWLWSAARILAVLVLAAGAVALAQAPLPEHFSGIISDYTPLIPTASPTGPWEMRGHWSLSLKGRSGKADFSAYMTMGLSDYWVLTTNSDATNPNIRSAHTHHIVMTDATVSFDTSTCPAYSPANTPRFVVTGPAEIVTGNGNPAPFQKNGTSSLQVCISGGSDVEYSNVTLVFTGPATGHFGPQPIHGAVRFPHKDNDLDDGHRH